MTSRDIEQIILKNGNIEIQSGVYLWSKDGIMGEAGCWDDEDACYNFDFTSYDFWITTNDATKPEGFDSIPDAMNSLN
jgi:hypothetical protein